MNDKDRIEKFVDGFIDDVIDNPNNWFTVFVHIPTFRDEIMNKENQDIVFRLSPGVKFDFCLNETKFDLNKNQIKRLAEGIKKEKDKVANKERLKAIEEYENDLG